MEGFDVGERGHADNPFGDDLIMLSHSGDGGLTWSTPAKVNQTPSGTFTDQAFEPAVHVNGSGVVAVSYYDFRNDVSGDGALTTSERRAGCRSERSSIWPPSPGSS